MGDRGGFGSGFGGRRGGRGDRGRGRGRGGRGRKDEKSEWVPSTKLGRLVKQVITLAPNHLTQITRALRDASRS